MRHAVSQRWRTVLAIGVTAALLTGCTAVEPADPRTSDQTESLSLSPASDEVYRCLKEKGWEVRITWDGGIEVDSSIVPTEQLDRYDTDEKACWAVIETRIDNMSTDQIRGVYKQELTTRTCLIDHGYEVEDPPTEQQYIDSFHGERWSAYGASTFVVTPPSAKDFKRISEACPQPAWSLGAS